MAKKLKKMKRMKRIKKKEGRDEDRFLSSVVDLVRSNELLKR